MTFKFFRTDHSIFSDVLLSCKGDYENRLNVLVKCCVSTQEGVIFRLKTIYAFKSTDAL